MPRSQIPFNHAHANLGCQSDDRSDIGKTSLLAERNSARSQLVGARTDPSLIEDTPALESVYQHAAGKTFESASLSTKRRHYFGLRVDCYILTSMRSRRSACELAEQMDSVSEMDASKYLSSSCSSAALSSP